MRETFGTNPATSTTPLNNNHLSFEECEGGKNGILFGGLLNNKFGIYSMITKTSFNNNGGASGHADLLFPSSSGNSAACIFGCNFDLPIERIDVWILN